MSTQETPATPVVAPAVPAAIALGTQPAPPVTPADPAVKPAEPVKAPEVTTEKPTEKPVEQPKSEEKPAEPKPAISPEESTKYQEEFTTNGDLSAESYAALEAKGFSKDTVQRYVEGQRAVAQLVEANVELAFGTMDNFNEFKGWAENNLSPEQRAEINTKAGEVISKGDMKAVRQFYQEQYANYREQVGTVGQLVGGRSAPSGAKPFGSFKEQVEAQMSPKYTTDTAYRREVEERIKASRY